MIVIIVMFLFAIDVKTGFANQNIQSLLIGWFQKERDITISHLEKEISAEKEKQMEILKAEVARRLVQADKELGDFTEIEIEIRRAALEKYTMELIEATEFHSEEERRNFRQEVDEIFSETMIKFEELKEKHVDSKE